MSYKQGPVPVPWSSHVGLCSLPFSDTSLYNNLFLS